MKCFHEVSGRDGEVLTCDLEHGHEDDHVDSLAGRDHAPEAFRDCRNCGGEGGYVVDRDGPTGHTQDVISEWVDCPVCNGLGWTSHFLNPARGHAAAVEREEREYDSLDEAEAAVA